MPRLVQPYYPVRGISPMQSQQQVSLPRSNNNNNSPRTPSSPTSPLDFTDKIPFNEIKLSDKTLGSGSYGTVYKGRWRGRNVAVKQFRTREEIESFLVEVQQLSRVKHQNIVTLYGASTPSANNAYLIMEYAEGGSLNHLLHECREQVYDLRHACSWAMQTARGVAHLHSITPKPIMHRDLKPANLLLFSRGRILKICDFGAACTVKTQMTNNIGSASYMAPEVFAKSSYLESGDVFSWSIIFWEILVRTHPYLKQSSAYQVLWNVNQGMRPGEIEGCPEPIWYLITRSWDKNPKRRPSMSQVAKEMELIFSLTERREQQLSMVRLVSSTSSSNSSSITSTHQHSHHYQTGHQQDKASGDEAIGRQHYEQFSRLQDQLTQSKILAAYRWKALHRHVESLRERHKQLEDALKYDRKNTASVSFEEFESLKSRIRMLRQSIKENSDNQSTGTTNRGDN